jgi:hypothetical protein
MQRVIDYMREHEIRPVEMFRAFDKAVNFKMGKKAFSERLKVKFGCIGRFIAD